MQLSCKTINYSRTENHAAGHQPLAGSVCRQDGREVLVGRALKHTLLPKLARKKVCLSKWVPSWVSFRDTSQGLPAPLCRQSGLHMQRYTEMRRSPSSPPPAFLSISTHSYTLFSHNHHPRPHPHPTLLWVLFCQDSSLTPDFQSPMSPASFSFLISVSPGFSLKAASLACCPAGLTGAPFPASLLQTVGVSTAFLTLPIPLVWAHPQDQAGKTVKLAWLHDSEHTAPMPIPKRPRKAFVMSVVPQCSWGYCCSQHTLGSRMLFIMFLALEFS